MVQGMMEVFASICTDTLYYRIASSAVSFAQRDSAYGSVVTACASISKKNIAIINDARTKEPLLSNRDTTNKIKKDEQNGNYQRF